MIEVGDTVGNYRVIARLGEGGMGKVFLAEHPVIGSKVALKAVHSHFSRNAEVVSRFVNEARAVNRIGHDHIVNITDFGTTPAGDFYFIMEYLQGHLLAERIRCEKPFPLERALRVAAQIADALHASHQQGVIHRDLKPENVLLITRDAIADFVKVFDFGLAKLMSKDGTPPVHNTGDGMVMGTPFYMSPEQCRGEKELDRRSDIYSLGVILFEMLTGRVPFSGEGYGEVMAKHVAVEAPPVRRFVSGLSPRVEAIVKTALAKDPGQRFQSMSDFREALLGAGRPSALPPAGKGPARPPMEVVAALPAASIQSATVVTTPAPAPGVESASTMRHGIGQLVTHDRFQPRHNWARVAVLPALALGLLAVVNGPLRREAGHVFAATVAARRPVTVRVNFSSDPDGALIIRSDGTILGTTPLSTEIPYSGTPVEYLLRKEGYAPKVSSFVPNLSQPVFTVLAKGDDEPAPPAVDPPRMATVTPPPVSPVKRAGHAHRQHASAPPVESAADGDEVMAPSTW